MLWSDAHPRPEGQGYRMIDVLVKDGSNKEFFTAHTSNILYPPDLSGGGKTGIT